jgi:uncharacterized protein (DUF302 family)
VLYVKDAAGTVESVIERLTDAVKEHGMGVLAVHDLQEKLSSAGVSMARECRVLEVWNAKRVRRALELDMAISTILPSRIAVFEHEGKVRVALLKPTSLLNLYQHPDLEPIAQEAEDAMICIVEAVCR